MKIYCKRFASFSDSLRRFVGKDVWLLVTILSDIPNPNNSAEEKYESLPQGQYYIQILSVDDDFCTVHLWDKDYFDVGAEWHTTLESALSEVYTLTLDQIAYYTAYPEVWSTEEMAEQFKHNVENPEVPG